MEEIPTFGSEAEEHVFWASHQLSDGLWEQAEPLAPDELPPPRPVSVTVVLELDEPTVGRLKSLARRRRPSYKTLLGTIVRRGLEGEERSARGSSRKRVREIPNV